MPIRSLQDIEAERETLHCDCYKKLVGRVLESEESLPDLDHVCALTAWRGRVNWAVSEKYKTIFDADAANIFLRDAFNGFYTFGSPSLRFLVLLPDGRSLACDTEEPAYFRLQGSKPPLVTCLFLVVRQWSARELKKAALKRYADRRQVYLDAGETDDALCRRGLFADAPRVLVSSFFLAPVQFVHRESGDDYLHRHKPTHVFGLSGVVSEVATAGINQAAQVAKSHAVWWEGIVTTTDYGDSAAWLPSPEFTDGAGRGQTKGNPLPVGKQDIYQAYKSGEPTKARYEELQTRIWQWEKSAYEDKGVALGKEKCRDAVRDYLNRHNIPYPKRSQKKT